MFLNILQVSYIYSLLVLMIVSLSDVQEILLSFVSLFYLQRIIIVNVFSPYAENHIRECDNFCFSFKYNLENSRERKSILFAYIFTLFFFFFPAVPRVRILSLPSSSSLLFYLQI